MSLGAIDFGLIVDSSVIMIENCVRRLAHEGGTRPKLEIVRDAAVEVRRPTMFGELIIAIVYLPILALQGTEGKLFRPMALTVIFALLGSLILSLTLMPVLAAMGLSDRPQEKEVWLIRWLKRVYQPALGAFVAHPIWAVLLALGLIAVSVPVGMNLGGEFMPRLNEGDLLIEAVRIPSASLEGAVEASTQIENLLETIPEVRLVYCKTGRPEIANDVMGVHQTDVWTMLKPQEEWRPGLTRDDLIEEMDKLLTENVPGVKFGFSQPIEMRVNELVAGVKSDVAAILYGPGPRRAAPALAGDRASPDGHPRCPRRQDADGRPAADAADQGPPRPARAVRHQGVRGPRRGRRAGRHHGRHDLRGRQAGVDEGPAARPAPAAGPAPRIVADRRRADRLDPGQGRDGPRDPAEGAGRDRRGGRARARSSATTCSAGRWSGVNVRGRDIASFVAEAQAAIDAQVKLPKSGGYVLRWGGQFEHLQTATQRLMIVVPVAMLLIFLLLYSTFHSMRLAMLIYTAVPMAATGGVFALAMRGLPFSVSAGVGFIALFGVAVLNGLVWVSAVEHLRQEGVEPHEAAREAAVVRLRPILMTALVAGLGFIPMAISTTPGAEIQRPLATVVIGGHHHLDAADDPGPAGHLSLVRAEDQAGRDAAQRRSRSQPARVRRRPNTTRTRRRPGSARSSGRRTSGARTALDRPIEVGGARVLARSIRVRRDRRARLAGRQDSGIVTSLAPRSPACANASRWPPRRPRRRGRAWPRRTAARRAGGRSASRPS